MSHHLRRRATAATIAAFLVAAGGVALAAPASAASPVVDTFDELVDALNASNTDADSNVDTITIAAGTITLEADLPTITEPVIIAGAGQTQTTIDGANTYETFVSTGVAVTISDLTVFDAGNDGIDSRGASLTLDEVAVIGSELSGVYTVDSNVSITDSFFYQNGDDGVEITLAADGTFSLVDSETSENAADGLQLRSPNSNTNTLSGVTAQNNTLDGLDLELADGSTAAVSDSLAIFNGEENLDLTAVGFQTRITVNAFIAAQTTAGTGRDGVRARLADNATLEVTNLLSQDNNHSGFSVYAAFDHDDDPQTPVHAGGIVTLTDSWITGNGDPSGFGGGIFVGENGDLIFDVTGTTVSGNTAGTGGGILAGLDPGSVLTISNSTISGNSAEIGGGVMVGSGENGFGHFLLTNSTVVDNVSGSELGGLAIGPLLSRVQNTISSGNTVDGVAGDLTVFAPVPGDFNLFEAADPADTTGSDNIFGQAAQLGVLQDNGGTTPTHLPQTGSPAIDAADPGYSGPLTTDQRGTGFDRVSNGRLDIGAVEVQVDSPDPDPDPDPEPDPNPDPDPDPSVGPSPSVDPSVDPAALAATGTDATVPLLTTLAMLVLGTALFARSRKARP